jgi:expansin (peptidoglycan-binding protein)
LSEQALIALSGATVAVPVVEWRSVPCDINGGVVVVTAQGSDSFRMEVLVKNHRVALDAVEIEKAGFTIPLTRFCFSKWITSERSLFNVWSGTINNLITPPWNIKFTGSTGEQIFAEMPTVIPGTSCSNQQFSPINPTTGKTKLIVTKFREH